MPWGNKRKKQLQKARESKRGQRKLNSASTRKLSSAGAQFDSTVHEEVEVANQREGRDSGQSETEREYTSDVEVTDNLMLESNRMEEIYDEDEDLLSQKHLQRVVEWEQESTETLEEGNYQNKTSIGLGDQEEMRSTEVLVEGTHHPIQLSAREQLLQKWPRIPLEDKKHELQEDEHC
jgi:hypothetical protein